MNKYFNIENFNKYLNFLRPWNYLGHPKLKLKQPKNKIELLIAMRDLRLWLVENAAFSSRKRKALSDLEHINREIHYIQFRRMAVFFSFWLSVWIYVRFFSPRHYYAGSSLVSRPIIAQQTAGTSMMHDGSIPKFEANDFNDITGGL